MLNYAETVHSSTIVPFVSLPQIQCHERTADALSSPTSSYAIGPLDPAQVTTLHVHLSSGEECSLLIPVHLPSSILTHPKFKEGYEWGYTEVAYDEDEEGWTVPKLVNEVYHFLDELRYENEPDMGSCIVGMVLGELANVAETDRTLALTGLAHLYVLLPCYPLDGDQSWPHSRFFEASTLHLEALRAYRAQVRTYREQGKSVAEARRLALAGRQADPAWSIGKDFGDWLYQGQPGEIRIPGFLNQVIDAAFAQGFWRGRALMLEREDGNWSILTDQEFTALIAQELPATLPDGAIASWKQGFIFGWCLTWHSQPFLDEEADAYSEDDSEAASCEAMY